MPNTKIGSVTTVCQVNLGPQLSRTAVARFARDLAALADVATDRVLVAVSGGADSLALLLLAHAVLGDRCGAATVDHALRPESAKEAAFVAGLCAARGIAHATLTGPLPDRVGRTANLSARARALRYRLLDEHAAATGADWIATAHHADDQLETLVMRLNRGAGVAGLAGVRAKSGQVIRPLLGWRHAELVALVAGHGIAAIDDPSNVSDRFDRARLRKALGQIDWLDVERAGASARALGDAEDAIEWMVARLAAERIAADGKGVTVRPDGLPFELRRRMAERAIRLIDPDADIRGPALVRVLDALGAGECATLGAVLCTPRGPDWRFLQAPPRRRPRSSES